MVDGTIDRHKAHLLAQGYSQLSGVDYSHTFSPVEKASTVRIVLWITVINDWPLNQLDVNNVFLHGTLHDLLHMEQPLGFLDPRYYNHGCCLNKALYGLKQAPHAWFHRLNAFLISNSFVCSCDEPSLFVFK